MADYETSLRRSLRDRAGALASYIDALEARSARSDAGFALALKMCHRYTEIVQRHIDEDLKDAPDPRTFNQFMRTWAHDFFHKEQWIDQRFARGSQRDVPRALKTIARREFKSSALNDYEPVLTVGPPDNFDASESDLARFLFSRRRKGETYVQTEIREPRDYADLPVDRKLSIISVPHIEGTRALWHPITLGHELGHVRIESDFSVGRALVTERWVDPDSPEFEAIEGMTGESWMRGRNQNLGTLEIARQVLQRWVNEVLCDVNTVRLFGPAGLSAIAEFVAVQRGTGQLGPELHSSTHPPLSVRLDVMFHFLRIVSGQLLPPHTSSWRDYVNTKRIDLEPIASYIATRITDEANLDQIVGHVATWGESYMAARRSHQVDWLRGELLDGIPGGTHCLSEEALGTPVAVADVVNGAWDARSTLDEFDRFISDTEEAEREDPSREVLLEYGLEAEDIARVLLRRNLDSHDRRLHVDSLASKAIDSIELAELWHSTGGGGGVEDITTLRKKVEPHAYLSGDGAILSRVAIVERMNDPRGEARLVVTPLLTDSIQDAGIDVRLGADFIVFRHSATAAFDALDKQQDPRMLQEAVEKDWGTPFILHPGELVLASTLEYIAVPEDIAAQVVTRSSYGRLGLITATAVQVQPGSRGCVTLELVNHADTPISLTPGARVAQLVFFTLHRPAKMTPGKYRFPIGPEFSKVEQDRDAEALELVKRTAQTNLSRALRFGTSDREVRFEFTLRQFEAARFLEIVEREGVDAAIAPAFDGGDMTAAERVAKLVAGEHVVLLVVSGTARVGALGQAMTRFSRAFAKGIAIEVTANVDPKTGEPPRDGPDAKLVIDGLSEPRLIHVVALRHTAPETVSGRDITFEPEVLVDETFTLAATGPTTELAELLRRAITAWRPKLPPDD